MLISNRVERDRKNGSTRPAVQSELNRLKWHRRRNGKISERSIPSGGIGDVNTVGFGTRETQERGRGAGGPSGNDTVEDIGYIYGV